MNKIEKTAGVLGSLLVILGYGVSIGFLLALFIKIIVIAFMAGWRLI